MCEFNVGDIVFRTNGTYNNMKPGDIDVVIGVADGGDGYAPGTIHLKEFGTGHNSDNLALKSKPQGWNYAEADRLQKEAEVAIQKYNDYISKKPTKEYKEILTYKKVEVTYDYPL